MFVAWTTVESRSEAEILAEGAVVQRLAACAQVEGPVTSFYHWEGKVVRGNEFRVWFKYVPANASALSAWVHYYHPYTTPQWVEVAAENVSEKYLSWVLANSTPGPFPESKST